MNECLESATETASSETGFDDYDWSFGVNPCWPVDDQQPQLGYVSCPANQDVIFAERTETLEVPTVIPGPSGGENILYVPI